MKNKALQKEASELNEKALGFMHDEQKLLKKYGLERRIIVSFPHRRRVPFFGKVAVTFLKWSRGVIDTEFAIKK